MRVMRQRRPPRVQHQGCTDAGAQVLRIRCDGQQGLGGHVEQQRVEHSFVLVRDGADRRGQGEDDVVVVHRQQIGLTRLEPALCRTGLALRTMPVAARVVGDLVLSAAFAAQHMAPQRRAAALFNGRHDLELAQAQVTVLRVAPSGTVGAEDVGNLQGRVRHGRQPTRSAASPVD